MQASKIYNSIFTYPAWLEHHWQSLALKTLARPEESTEASLQRLEKPIQSLSDFFTIERPDSFFDYTEGLSLLAYGLFFFPQTFARLRFPLIELIELHHWQPTHKAPIRILDLGAGLGAAGLSAALLLRDRFKQSIELTALDHSPQALLFLQSLFKAQPNALSSIQLKTLVADLKSTDKIPTQTPFDIILCSFALNEAFPKKEEPSLLQWLLRLKTHLTQKGLLLLLEPALKKNAIQLQSIADRLVIEQKMYRWAPANHSSPYPASLIEKYPPHEVRRWEPPNSLSFLNRRLFRSITELKFHFAALSPQAAPSYPQGPEYCRLVSPMTRHKGQFSCFGLSNDGHIYHYEWPLRHLNKNDISILCSIERGDSLRLKNLISLKNPGHFRIASIQDIVEHWSVSSYKLPS